MCRLGFERSSPAWQRAGLPERKRASTSRGLRYVLGRSGGLPVWKTCRSLAWLLLFQEDISRLRRKLEKQRKVEVYADADEILQEEIKEYKVGYDWLVTVGPGTLAVSLK